MIDRRIHADLLLVFFLVGSSVGYSATPVLPHIYRSGINLGPYGGTLTRGVIYWKNTVYASVDAETCQTGQQASSSTVYSVDVSNPDNLQYISKGIDGGCKANAMVVVEDRLYVAGWSVLMRLCDVAQPGIFNTVIDYSESGRFGWGITAANQRAYIDEGHELGGAFYIMDVSNPAIPTVISRTEDISGSINRGSYAYRGAVGNYFVVLNISDEANPYDMASVNAGASIGNPALQDHYVFLDAAWPNASTGMVVYDVSNPTLPVQIGSWVVPNGPSMRGLVLFGNMAFIPTSGNGFYTVDISNPANPVTLAQTEVPYYALELGITANDRFVYVGTAENSGGGVHAFQVLDADADDKGPRNWTNFSLGEAPWDLQYECDATPTASSPLWTLVEGSNAFASVSGGILRINDNGTNSGDKVKWAIPWDATNSRGTTVLTRARCASYAANGNLSSMGNIFIRDGRFSEDFSILSDRFRAIHANQEYALDGTAWHTYRITTKGTVFNVYVDEAAAPVMTGTLFVTQTQDSEAKRARLWIGSGSSFSTQDIYFDYVYAYSNGVFPPTPALTTVTPAFTVNVADSYGKNSLSGINPNSARVQWSTDGGATWSTSGAAFWAAQYTGDVLPSVSTPSWSVPEGSETWASVSGGVLRINDTSTASGSKVKWARSWNASPAVGTTLVARARCASVGGDTTLLGNLFVEDGVKSELFKIMTDRLVASNAGLTYFLDGTQWHIYRVITKNTQFSVYLDEQPTAVMTGTLSTASSNNRVMFGSGSSAATQDIYFDYVEYTAAGDLPPGLGDGGGPVTVTCTPINTIVPADRGTLTTTGIPFNQNSDTLNRVRFSLDDLAGNIGYSPAYIVRINHLFPNPDFNRDGDIDQEDFGRFQACISGGGIPYPQGCFDADLDEDNDVDSQDFNLFLNCMSGANKPIPSQCVH